MTWTIVGIVVLGIAAGVGGFGLLLAAIFAPNRRLAGPVRGGDREGRCPCCGYSTAGLEEDRCPECGGLFDQSSGRMARRRRIALAAAGLGLGGCALASYPAADAVRFGLVHSLPSIALVELLRMEPSWHVEIARELQGRADAGQIGEWTSAAMARVCEEMIAVERDGATRRDAAWLLTRVVRHVDPSAVGMMVRDRDAGVRAFGVEVLRLADEADGSPTARLNALVLQDASELVRKRAIDAVRYRSEVDGRMTSTLVMALEDPSDGVRQRALLALGESRDASEESMRAVARRRSDESPDVRWIAAVALGRMSARRPEALGMLAESLDDVSPLVRASAASTLGQAGASHAWVLPRLLESAIADEDEVVRGVAMEAIRAIVG